MADTSSPRRRDIADDVRTLVLAEFQEANQTSADYETLIRRAHAVRGAADDTLLDCVGAGRRAGLSWAAIGGLLGITKQAAQQRFGANAGDASDADAADAAITEVRGATALNEIVRLREHGAAGRELVAVGPLRLLVRQTEQAWSHKRAIVGLADARPQDGWQVAAYWFPFVYLKRPAGVLTDPADLTD